MFRPKSPYVPSAASSTANALATTGASVNVSNAAPPVVGQVLGASSAAQGDWVYPFAMHNDLANVINDYSASGVYTSTTTSTSTSAGSTTVYLTDASTFKASQGINILGAGTAGGEHSTTIASVNTVSNYVVLDDATVTTVGAGAVVYHDDTLALQSMIDEGNLIGGYIPRGDFIVSAAGRARAMVRGAQTYGAALLDMTRYSGKLVGANLYGLNSGGDAYANGQYSTIWARSATDDSIFVGSDEVVLLGFRIQHHTSVTRTAGIGVLTGPKENTGAVYETVVAHLANRPTIKFIKVNGHWDGFHHGYSWELEMSNCEARYFRHNGFVHDCVIPGGGAQYSNLLAAAEVSGAYVNAGYYINRADQNQWTMIKTVNCKYGWHQNSVTGTGGGQQIVTNSRHDNVLAGGIGIYIQRNQYGNQFLGGVINVSSGGGGAVAWNLSANSKRNRLSVVYSGTIGTDAGTNNDVSTCNPTT